MKRLFSVLTLAAAVATTAIILSCGDDDPASAGAGSVSGTVTFIGSRAWPTVGEVQVGIYAHLDPPDYAPTGPPDAFTLAIEEPVTGQYSYHLAGLDYGTYTGILVSWREANDPGGARMLGMYWIYPDSLGIQPDGVTAKAPGPAPIAIKSSKPKHTGLDIKADIDLVP